MARSLAAQAAELQRVMAQLLKKYQFRDRNETVCYGLSVSQAYALRALNESGALTMSELAAEMRLSLSTMTRIVDQLVRRALVVRMRSPLDRRICDVAPTRAGRTLWARIEAELIASDREVLRGISPRERELVIEVIARLSEAVDVWRAKKAGQEG